MKVVADVRHKYEEKYGGKVEICGDNDKPDDGRMDKVTDKTGNDARRKGVAIRSHPYTFPSPFVNSHRVLPDRIHQEEPERNGIDGEIASVGRTK